MIKSVLQFYSIFICLMCMMVFLFCGGSLLNSLVNIYFPEYKHTHHFYASDELYKEHYLRTHNKMEVERFRKLSPEEVTKSKKAEHDKMRLSLYRQDLSWILFHLSYIFIAAIIFGIHWMLHRRWAKA